MTVSPTAIEEEIRNSLPGTSEIIVQYLSGYLLDLDDAAEDEDVLQVARSILSSARPSKSLNVDGVINRLGEMLGEELRKREEGRTGVGAGEGGKGKSGLIRLEKVVEMGKTGGMSSTIAFNEGVDLESVNKGKWVGLDFVFVWVEFLRYLWRASRVDVKKLEKQEAKLRVRFFRDWSFSI